MNTCAHVLPSRSFGSVVRVHKASYATSVSSYRARGLLYLAAREFYDEFVPGGVLAVQQALDTETAQFFEQIFLGSAMYDIMPLVRISETAARLAGLTHEELATRNAAWQAEHDLRGVYKLFVRMLTPDAVACRLPKLALKYFDFGSADARMQGERCCVGELCGVPDALASWMSACIRGYVPPALELAGAQHVRVQMLDVDTQAEPDRPGHVTLRLEIRWT